MCVFMGVCKCAQVCTGCALVCKGLPRCVWKCSGICGYKWVRNEFSEYFLETRGGVARVCTGVHGYVWMCMDVHGCAWICTDVHGYAWMCPSLCGCVQVYGFTHGCACVCMVVCGMNFKDTFWRLGI